MTAGSHLGAGLVSDSEGQEVPGEGLLELPLVVRGRPAGESAVAEDMVEVEHEGHRGLGGEQPVGAGVREDEAVRRAAADILLVQPVRREREHEQSGLRRVVRGPFAPLFVLVFEVAADRLAGVARALCLDHQRVSRCRPGPLRVRADQPDVPDQTQPRQQGQGHGARSARSASLRALPPRLPAGRGAARGLVHRRWRGSGIPRWRAAR